MAVRHNDGAHYENYQRAAELHEMAAHAHRAAAERIGQQDHPTGQELARQALEHSRRAYLYTQHATGKISTEEHVAVFTHEQTEALADQLGMAKDRPESSPENDWFQAEDQLPSRE